MFVLQVQFQQDKYHRNEDIKMDVQLQYINQRIKMNVYSYKILDRII